jgi:hypothetical protein
MNILTQEYGIPAGKLNIGAACYFRGKQGEILVDGYPDGAVNITSETVFGTWENTVIEGYDLFKNIAGPDVTGIIILCFIQILTLMLTTIIIKRLMCIIVVIL